jgi:hypothetical protein
MIIYMDDGFTSPLNRGTIEIVECGYRVLLAVDTMYRVVIKQAATNDGVLVGDWSCWTNDVPAKYLDIYKQYAHENSLVVDASRVTDSLEW